MMEQFLIVLTTVRRESSSTECFFVHAQDEYHAANLVQTEERIRGAHGTYTANVIPMPTEPVSPGFALLATYRQEWTL